MIIVTQFQNAEDRLEEWLYHHAWMGFTKFYLYDDNSNDKSVEIINNINNLDIVLKPSIQNSPDFNIRIVDSSNDALFTLKKLTKEIPIAFIDIDEYIVAETSVKEIIANELLFNKYDILYLPSYDVKPTYSLKNGNITSNTVYRWSEYDKETQLNGLYKNRGKSITTNHRCPEIKNIHVLHDEENGVGLVKGVSKITKNIRIHHFRLPPQFDIFNQFDDTLVNITTKRIESKNE